MSRLFNTSNRVVVPEVGQNVAGGLDNTLTECKGFDTVVRLGHSGDLIDNHKYDFEHPENHVRTVQRTRSDGRSTVYHLLDLPRDHQKAFYGDVANEKMWHAFHARPDLVTSGRDAYRMYKETCTLYAKATKALIQDEDEQVDHDYHNVETGASARSLGVTRPMSLVLHIPVPERNILTSPLMDKESSEFMLNIFENSIFAYDMISVQAPRDLRNMEGILGVKNPFEIDAYQTKRIRNRNGDSTIVGVFPATGDTAANEFKLKQSLGNESINNFWYLASDGRIIDGKKQDGQKLIVAADRIDPSKALDKRLRAIQMGVTEGTIDPRTVCFMQAAAQSRETLNGYPKAIKDYAREYTKLRDQFNFHVYSPNKDGKFLPLDQASIFVGYNMADAGLFVSDFDGMHLGPKEFTDVADRANPGACIVTKTIGAAHEFRHCSVVVEPTEEGIKNGLIKGLSMPLEERIEQNEMRREIMEQNSNQRWIDSIVHATKNRNPTFG